MHCCHVPGAETPFGVKKMHVVAVWRLNQAVALTIKSS